MYFRNLIYFINTWIHVNLIFMVIMHSITGIRITHVHNCTSLANSNYLWYGHAHLQISRNIRQKLRYQESPNMCQQCSSYFRVLPISQFDVKCKYTILTSFRHPCIVVMSRLTTSLRSDQNTVD